MISVIETCDIGWLTGQRTAAWWDKHVAKLVSSIKYEVGNEYQILSRFAKA